MEQLISLATEVATNSTTAKNLGIERMIYARQPQELAKPC
jgi:hypothetical protein